MGLFKNLENKAKQNLGKFQEDIPYINEARYKNNLGKETGENLTQSLDEFDDDFNQEMPQENGYQDEYSHLQASQKPESFHFFILENQYQDLERMIRGVKDVFDKERNEWRIKKKDKHCFTDEEAEDIVRTAQSHLSPDIKLAYFSKDEYPIILNGIYEQMYVMFKSIMEYRFGRYGNKTIQYNMKQQAVNIFNALMMRIKANYSRAIMGSENKATHQSVKGQESLNQPKMNGDDRSY